MKQTILGSLIAFLLAGGAAGYGYTVVRNTDADIFESSVHQVARVIDGDTVDVENDTRIRLIGIDAPEREECGYVESKDFIEKALDGRHVRIQKDVSGSDQYGRLLRYVHIVSDDVADDDVLLNLALLEAGHAKTLAIAPDIRYRDLFATAQDEARRDGRGLWGMCAQSDDVEQRQQDSQPVNAACIIKGNISEKAFGRNYFLPSCPNYYRIKIDTRKGEAYFCSEDEAVAAGFTRSESCDNTF